MDIPELNKRLGKVIQQSQNFDNGRIMVKIAISAFTLLRQRVQETGVDAKGQKYRPYSTKDMFFSCKSFVKKSACEALLDSKEKRKELEWRTVKGHKLPILEGGYKKWRELQGRRTDIVNFSVTNAMWNDINVEKSGLVSKPADHMRGIAIIGAKQELEKKKLAGNTKRRGNILDLSASEIEDLKLKYKVQELQIFRENGII